MFIKKISNREWSLLLASSRLNTYKKAAEELVYNALDAESTSIAIRIHIEQNSMQVIDNGCGITKEDLNIIGQRYMTSKYTENIKSVSTKYGFRGESLANIVGVSETVSITSRHETSDGTSEKRFHSGKQENLMEVIKRPSKGTTIEIKGYLYNLKLQKKSINPINELQEIKIFLEQISLVHSNTSLSLRDDSKNEIILQLHKKRDIYQTLSSLYSIDKSEIQELKVEKNQYAVTGFIAKNIKDINKDWIYLNRKFVNNTSRLHKIVNDNLNMVLKNQIHRKKSKIEYNNEENHLFKYKLPFYFLFIQCPGTDYYVTEKLVEFHNWNQINAILEKIVKFYGGGVKLKAITNDDNIRRENEKLSGDTREQVKEIIYKILATDSNMLGVSQMKKGIKGKITKRKNKKKHIAPVKKHSQSKFTSEINKHLVKTDGYTDDDQNNMIQSKTIRRNKKHTVGNKTCRKKFKQIEQKSNAYNVRKFKFRHGSNDLDLKDNVTTVSKKIPPVGPKTKSNNYADEFIDDPIIKRFINPTDSLNKRCEIIALNAQKVINNFNMRKSEVYVDKSVQCIDRNANYKNIDIYTNREYKRHNEQKYLVLQNRKLTFEKHIKSTYDLLKSVIYTQDSNNKMNAGIQSVVRSENKFKHFEFKSKYTASEVIKSTPVMPKLTYESHNYEIIRSKTLKGNESISAKLMSKISRDNLVIPDGISRPKVCQRKTAFKRYLKERNQTSFKNISRCINETSVLCTAMQNIEEYSQIFEFSKNNLSHKKNTIDEVNLFFPKYCLSNYNTENNISVFAQHAYKNAHDTMDFIHNKTHTLLRDFNIDKQHAMCLQENIYSNALSSHTSDNGNTDMEKNDCIFSVRNSGTVGNKIIDEKDDLNSAYISGSQGLSEGKSLNTNYVPMDVCEAIYFNNDICEKDFEFSFNVPNVDVNPNTIFFNDNDNEICNTQNNIENISYHFNNINSVPNSLRWNIEGDNNVMKTSVADKKQMTDSIQDNHNKYQLIDTNLNEKYETMNLNSFNMNNRLRFVPKGMSQIFKNCNTKHVCNYNSNKDYYEEILYQDFVNEVQINSEIYKAQIQNVKGHTKRVNKCKSKTDTNHYSLSFDGKCLEYAKILNQVDDKFIAAVIKNMSKQDDESSNFLVLFDQHAVHERIRLENNLSEYLADGQWKSVSVDSFTMLLPNDEILYLHNYKEKFQQFGLQWTIPNSNEIVVTAIPEAILGKNPRQVEKIIIAVRNLIMEQINNIKSQKGCISLYPKSIMDLVFSEACRYAVMFGDKLTKDYCRELLKDLSKCKKPFHCAHGRPAMAVLMDFEYINLDYKANLTKLKRFV